MERYLYSYIVISTGKEGEFSTVAESPEKAEAVIQERIADMEFTDETDIRVGQLLKTIALKEHYYECEGCT